jgi:hypothetical protein
MIATIVSGGLKVVFGSSCDYREDLAAAGKPVALWMRRS